MFVSFQRDLVVPSGLSRSLQIANSQEKGGQHKNEKGLRKIEYVRLQVVNPCSQLAAM